MAKRDEPGKTQDQTERRKRPPADVEPEPPDEKVDEASWESFPASDPPSFTPQKVG